jgi:hypothetical protein
LFDVSIRNMTDLNLQKKWMSFRIFSSVENFHLIFFQLLKTCELTGNKNVDGFIIKPDFGETPNIVFSMLLNADSLSKSSNLIEKEFLTVFKHNYLTKANLHGGSKDLKSKEFIFEQIGINTESSLNISDTGLETDLTLLILEALSNEEISEELDLPITLGYYMHLVLLKSYLSILKLPLHKKLFIQFEQDYAQCQILDQYQIGRKFSQSIQLLKEIKSDVFNETNLESITWIKRFENIISLELGAAGSESVDTQMLTEKIYYLQNMVNQRLGMEKDAGQILNCFINGCFFA